MSDWDEKAQVVAEYLTAQARMPKVTAEYVEPILVEMALLQRKLLLSDETVERAARGMFEWDTEEHPFSRPAWEGLSEAQRDVWRSGARATLAAALGEGESDE